MPSAGRAYPASQALHHDYVTYFNDNTTTLWTSGHAVPTSKPLASYPPAQFTVRADPRGFGERTDVPAGDPRDETMTDEFWMAGHWEVDSELVVPHADVIEVTGYTAHRAREVAGIEDLEEPGVPVTLGRTSHAV